MAEAKRRPFAIYEFSPSMTKQSFKEECDVNEILRRAQTGQDITASFRAQAAKYGDFSEVPSYQEAMNVVREANDMFMSLPATIRERFSNDPDVLMRFLQDEANYDEAVKLGLVNAKVPEDIEPVKTKASSDQKTTKAKPMKDDDEA